VDLFSQLAIPIVAPGHALAEVGRKARQTPLSAEEVAEKDHSVAT
jgi:hypothetical protein